MGESNSGDARMIVFLVLALLSSPRCVVRDHRPDPACTPGAAATTSLSVICGTSTKTRRRVSEATKRAALTAYGIRWADRGACTLDHLVSLEVGGTPNDARNLWPEDPAEARRKDRVENELHRLVCSGAMSPEEAQRREAADWTTAAKLATR